MPIDLVIDDRDQRADLEGANGGLGLGPNMIPMNNGRSSSVDASHHSDNGYTPDQVRADLNMDIKVCTRTSGIQFWERSSLGPLLHFCLGGEVTTSNLLVSVEKKCYSHDTRADSQLFEWIFELF